MADESNVPNGGEPPKIKLSGVRTGSGDTDKVRLSAAGQTPPKIQLRSAESKKSTTRIDLADVIAPPSAGDGDIKTLSPEKQAEFFKKSTIRIDQSASQAEAKRITSRIDQSGATTGETQKVPSETSPIDARRSTIRIDPGAASGQGDTARIDVLKTTMRVDQPPAGSTQPVQGETSKIDAKRSTIRIDQTPGGTGDTQKVQGETSRIDVKKSTIRIDAIPQTGSGDTQRTGGETKRIDLKTVETGQLPPPSAPVTPKLTDSQQQQKKKETTRLEIPAEIAKRQTGKIQTGPLGVEPPDVFKKRTGKLSTAPVALPPVVPVTPSVAAQPSGAADTVARPKTILVRRTPRPSGDTPSKPIAVTQAVAQQTAMARKSETARLEIPKDVGGEDRPTTRPKTIRIKRPDGTTARKQLTIARPSEGEESSLPEGLRQPAAIAARGDSTPGGIWTILAIAATLVIGTLIYVLLAESPSPFTHWLELPFPGKIG